MASYFIENKPYFHLVEPTEASPAGFRNCQLGAIWAVKAHFTASADPALVNMPTGTGKTAVMIALSFELSARRVFVLTPSQLVRNQTTRKFQSLSLLEEIGALRSASRPLVHEIQSECNSLEDWQKLLDWDVVVATPQAVSPRTASDQRKAILPPPDTFFGTADGSASGIAEFDLIFVDEAHHAPAQSWASFLRLAGRARVVFLTATPFRRDRKRIRARPVFSYPIAKAMDDGIYRRIRFEEVHEIDPRQRDTRLAETALRLFREVQERDPDAAIIIKTDTKARANLLAETYRAAGWTDLGIIHSDKAPDANINVVQRVHADLRKRLQLAPLNGFISVAIGGEGLDIPNLRIAVFHQTPKTLPWTIQLIGRVSRVGSADPGESILIADPALAQGSEVEDLFKSDEGWNRMLPQLFDRYSKQSRYLPQPGSRLATVPWLLNDDLTPYHSVRVYKQRRKGAGLKPGGDEAPAETDEVSIELLDFQPSRSAPSLVLVITRVWMPPSWTDSRDLESERFDLHIFYTTGPLLFECTSSERICRLIKGRVYDRQDYSQADYFLLRKGLSDALDGHFYMLGLRNYSGVSNGIPEYKIYQGDAVERAVRTVDGRYFGTGHAMMKTGSETRGVAIASGRIWSNRRGSIPELTDWCDSVAKLLRATASGPIPLVEDNLMVPEIIDRYPDNLDPIAIVLSHDLHINHVTVLIEGRQLDDPYLHMSRWELNGARNELDVTLDLCDPAGGDIVRSLALRHDLQNAGSWTQRSSESVHVEIDPGSGEERVAGSLLDILQSFPPRIVLESGAVIVENRLFTPKIQHQRLDPLLLENKSWDHTDLTKEADPPRSGYLYNVHQKTIEIIKQIYNLGADDLLICDDRANEVADFVLIQGGRAKSITFFHCKYKRSAGAAPGVAKDDVTELTEQGIRTGHWIQSNRLIERLRQRVNGSGKKTGSTILHPADPTGMDRLHKLSEKFHPTRWTYRVVLVQPALSRSRIKDAKNPSQAEQLLVMLSDRIADVGADFRVWCSD